MNALILLAFLLYVAWLIRRDTRQRAGISGALWIPTLWVGILASRPLSSWVGFGGAEDTLEGSPLDRLFFFGLIALAYIVVFRRGVSWSQVMASSWPVFLFYGYLLVSVFWAESPVVSFKRWFKDFGNIAVALVILSEANPAEAFRAVFVRCGYILIPLSYIFIRWFPDLGRHYSIHSGEMEATGVTFQKNSLGALVLVCGLVLIWDWLEKTQPDRPRPKSFDRYLPLVILGIGAYLLWLCDSKTSMACFGAGALVLLAGRLPILRHRVRSIGLYALVAGIGFVLFDSLFGVREAVVSGLGRDLTMTGRTDVWRVLLALGTDPVIGTGFCSFWSDMTYQSRLPDWVAFSAHNGYLETYIDGGFVGLGFLALMLLGVGVKLNRRLAAGDGYALLRMAVFLAAVIGDISESHFARMSPLWFLFLLAALDPIEGRGGPRMKIPMRIIQTGKSRELPPLARAAMTNVRLLHPDWEQVFFDDDGVRRFIAAEFPRHRPVFDAFRWPIQRFDFFRYLAVYRLGGFYFDLDVFLHQPLTPLLGHDCVFPFEELTLSRYLRRQHKLDWEIGNFGFGAAPGHPFLAAVIENCVRAQRDREWVRPMMREIPWIFRSEFEVLNTTGPGLITRTLAENPALAGEVTVLFPDDVCDSRSWHQFGAFGAHLMAGSWRSPAGFLRRRLAGWCEARLRARLMRESQRLGRRRDGIPAGRPAPSHVAA